MEKSGLDIVRQTNLLKFRYPKVAFLYALRDLSYGITSNDFGNPKSDTRASLVREKSPETPLKLKNYGGKINEKKKQSNQCKTE